MIDVPKYIKDSEFYSEWLKDNKLRKECYKKAKIILDNAIYRIDTFARFFEKDDNPEYPIYGKEYLDKIVNYKLSLHDKTVIPYLIAKEQLEDIQYYLGFHCDTRKDYDLDRYKEEYKKEYEDKRIKSVLTYYKECSIVLFFIAIYYLFNETGDTKYLNIKSINLSLIILWYIFGVFVSKFTFKLSNLTFREYLLNKSEKLKTAAIINLFYFVILPIFFLLICFYKG